MKKEELILPFFGRDGKLRGLKRQCYEGGFVFRSLFVGRVKYPKERLMIISLAFYDLMPTFCDLAGVKNYVKKYN